MVHKKRGKYGIKIRPEAYYPPVATRKKGLSIGLKVLIALGLIAVIVVASSFVLSSQKSQTGPTPSVGASLTTLGETYPQSVSPVFYTSATLTPNSSKVVIPSSYVQSNKLVFVDLKLEAPTETLSYQNRNIPLNVYRNGGYLPLVIISTPSGNIVAGIRTCEPCGSFSFHIVKGTNLKCDVCGTEWTLENFTPVSGGCGTYPPPKVTGTVNGNKVEIDLSALQIQIASA